MSILHGGAKASPVQVPSLKLFATGTPTHAVTPLCIRTTNKLNGRRSRFPSSPNHCLLPSHSMVSRRADDAFMALLRTYHSQRFCRVAVRGARGGGGILRLAHFSTSSFARHQAVPDLSPDAAPNLTKETRVPKDVAVIGGGITGLTTAHYLAKLLPETSNITVFEAADRLGGWIDTQEVEVDVKGQKNIVRFERGPRTLRGMGKDTWRFDDFVLFDLVGSRAVLRFP